MPEYDRDANNVYNDWVADTVGGKIAVRTNDDRCFRLVRMSDGAVLANINDRATAVARANALIAAGSA